MAGYTIVFRLATTRRPMGGNAPGTARTLINEQRALPVLSKQEPSPRGAAGVRRGIDLSTVYTVAGVEGMDEAADLLDSLQADESVELAYVAPPRGLLVHGGAKGSPGPLLVNDWHAQINLPLAAALPQWNGRNPVSIALVDSGYDVAHPQLTDGGYTNHFQRNPPNPDPMGHGTHVSGVICAGPCPSNQFKGLAPSGTDWQMHLGIGVAQDVSAYYRALRAASAARVINLSLGGDGHDPLEADILREAMNGGSVIVAAAGNSGDLGSPETFPAALDGVIAVGAVDRAGNKAQFSNEGTYIFVCAPGVDIVSTVPTYRVPHIKGVGSPPLAAMSGTSMAAPIVTAVIARMLAFTPSLSSTQVTDLIQGNHGKERKLDVGRGVLDAHATISSL